MLCGVHSVGLITNLMSQSCDCASDEDAACERSILKYLNVDKLKDLKVRDKYAETLETEPLTARTDTDDIAADCGKLSFHILDTEKRCWV